MFPKILGLCAAVLFGASAPFSKLLLNDVSPIQLAGFLYVGSGTCLLIIQLLRRHVFRSTHSSPPLRRSDILPLVGAILSGGVIAPVILMLGLARTPAMTASILLNFEAVATTAIAALFFREYTGRRLWGALLSITLGGIILSLKTDGGFGVSLGAVGVLVACIFWGIDNNLTRKISAVDPIAIVMAKGFSAGLFNLVLATSLGFHFPSAPLLGKMLLLGGVSYGLSLLLFILSLRDLGAARTSSLFAAAPFLGAIISYLIFRNTPDIQFLCALPLMILGVWLLFREHHSHLHQHQALTHEHMHTHADQHHEHHHDGQVGAKEKHSHQHTHEPIQHEHEHSPDLHHRHRHEGENKAE